VTPNSCPIFRSFVPSPSSAYLSSEIVSERQVRSDQIRDQVETLSMLSSCHNTHESSVGKAPAPTRVEYALTTPNTCLMNRGGNPSPVATPPADVDDDVTYLFDTHKKGPSIF
jgi:hypothetical protein